MSNNPWQAERKERLARSLEERKQKEEEDRAAKKKAFEEKKRLRLEKLRMRGVIWCYHFIESNARETLSYCGFIQYYLAFADSPSIILLFFFFSFLTLAYHSEQAKKEEEEKRQRIEKLYKRTTTRPSIFYLPHKPFVAKIDL